MRPRSCGIWVDRCKFLLESVQPRIGPCVDGKRERLHSGSSRRHFRFDFANGVFDLSQPSGQCQ